MESHTAQVTAGNWLRRLCVVAAVLFALTALARAQGGQALTNDDVVKMVRAQLAASVILTTIQSASTRFDLSPAGLITLKEAGVEDRIIEAMQAKARVQTDVSIDASARNVPEKSELLASSKDPDFILRNFKTMLVDATRATYFGSQQMKAAIGANRDFMALKVSIVDDPGVADVVLTVSYTFCVGLSVHAEASEHEPGAPVGEGDWCLLRTKGRFERRKRARQSAETLSRRAVAAPAEPLTGGNTGWRVVTLCAARRVLRWRVKTPARPSSRDRAH